MTQPPPAAEPDAPDDGPQQPDDVRGDASPGDAAEDPAQQRQHREWAAEDAVVDANPTRLGE